MSVAGLRTERLLLRQWRPEDRAPFAAMNADPRVMAHFPALLDRAASDERAANCERRIAGHGFGLWALERRDGGDFIGFCGLAAVPPGIDVPAGEPPALEIGWRLAADHWGQGLASEAARAVLADGFGRLRLDWIVSFTAETNHRSQAVMRRIGLREIGRFIHPRIDTASPIAPHVMYGLRRTTFVEESH